MKQCGTYIFRLWRQRKPAHLTMSLSKKVGGYPLELWRCYCSPLSRIHPSVSMNRRGLSFVFLHSRCSEPSTPDNPRGILRHWFFQLPQMIAMRRLPISGLPLSGRVKQTAHPRDIYFGSGSAWLRFCAYEGAINATAVLEIYPGTNGDGNSNSREFR